MEKIITSMAIIIACISNSLAQSPVKIVTGNLTNTVNWSNDTIYLLQGKVYVKSGGTLNIAPGTVIKGDKATAGSSLIITRGGKINAIGTAMQPIVFTSSATPGNRVMGDWGGLVIAGNARINVTGGIGTFEGGNLANPDGTSSDGQYGGLNDLDNSGELKFVRIEFAGFAFAPNNELNSLTLGGVGSGTKISYVQCSYSLDDAFEWFGGNVNADHLIAFRGNDDDFDTDFGYSGKVQFGVCMRDTNVADAVSGAMAFESDNDGGSSGANPYTSPVFSNMTLVGPRHTPTTTFDVNFRRGAHIRRNSRMSLFNSIVMGWPTGLKIDGDSCHANADNGSLAIKNSVLAGCVTNLDSEAGTVWNMTPWFNTTAFSNSVLALTTDVQLSSPFNYAAPDFKPTTASPMLTGADFTDAKLTSGFTTVAYRGAFGTTDWTAGWANFQPDTNAYTTGIYPLGVSNIVRNTMNVSLFPNPANNLVSVRFNSEINAPIKYSIVDFQGKIILENNFKAIFGVNEMNINISNLNNGLYILKLTQGNQIHTEKLSVLR